jgi:hypothetical protein
VAATAQSIAFAEGLGLDPRAFLDMMKGGAVDAPYLHVKGEAIIAGQFATSFAVDGAVKDTGLIAAAMRDGGTDAALMDAIAGQYRKASDAGHGEADMAAVYHAFRPLSDLSMRRNASTVVVLPGPAPADVLAAASRSMNVALIRPADPADDDGDGFEAAAAALRQAGRSTSPYALVPADPLAAVAASWQAMWDVSRPEGSAGFEQEAARALAAWRSGRFELPDYYLILATAPAYPGAHPGQAGEQGADFYLGPLRSTRPHRVVLVAATEPVQQAVGVLQALGSLRHGPWWPGLDEVIEVARAFYPDRLAEGMAG